MVVWYHPLFFMQFSILGGSHIITLDKNVIEGAQRGKTGLIGNIDNTCVGTLQKLNCILQSQAVDIVWETEIGQSDFDNAGSLCHG